GEFSLAARDKYVPYELSWKRGWCSSPTRESSRATAYWAKSRAKASRLASSKRSRDFAQFRSGWFSRFHEALKPTLDERARRADRYLHLLASKIPPTVSFAVNALKLLDNAGQLPAAAVVAHAGPVLLARSKGTAREALKLLDRAAQTDPARKDEIARVAADAIRHESAEVQGAVLDLLDRHGSHSDKVLTQLLGARAGDVAASQRQRLQAWLDDAPAQPVKRAKAATASKKK